MLNKYLADGSYSFLSENTIEQAGFPIQVMSHGKEYVVWDVFAAQKICNHLPFCQRSFFVNFFRYLFSESAEENAIKVMLITAILPS